MFSVTPDVCSAECEVFVGLILQYHYVGLDKLPVCGKNVQQCVQSSSSTADVHSNPSVNTVSTADVHSNPSVNTVNTEEEALDDATIEEGDEHRRQISGAPMASMMCVENPESSRDIICVAPAEGEKPINIMTDSNFEPCPTLISFPLPLVHLALRGLKS